MLRKIAILMAVAVILITETAYAVSVDLPETGQNKCYDESGILIPCTGSRMDGELQKGIAWPNPRFTTNADTTVTDNLTGLVWTPDGGTPTVGSCTGGKTDWWGAFR